MRCLSKFIFAHSRRKTVGKREQFNTQSRAPQAIAVTLVAYNTPLSSLHSSPEPVRAPPGQRVSKYRRCTLCCASATACWRRRSRPPAAGDPGCDKEATRDREAGRTPPSPPPLICDAPALAARSRRNTLRRPRAAAPPDSGPRRGRGTGRAAAASRLCWMLTDTRSLSSLSASLRCRAPTIFSDSSGGGQGRVRGDQWLHVPECLGQAGQRGAGDAPCCRCWATTSVCCSSGREQWESSLRVRPPIRLATSSLGGARAVAGREPARGGPPRLRSDAGRGGKARSAGFPALGGHARMCRWPGPRRRLSLRRNTRWMRTMARSWRWRRKAHWMRWAATLRTRCWCRSRICRSLWRRCSCSCLKIASASRHCAAAAVVKCGTGRAAKGEARSRPLPRLQGQTQRTWSSWWRMNSSSSRVTFSSSRSR